MNCPSCAAVIAGNSQFCPKCGANLGAGGTATGYSPVGAVPGAAVTPSRTSGKAIASLVLGILVFVPFSSIAAVILGHLSLSEIRKSAGRLGGHGMAVAGLILGYMGIALIPFVLIIAAIAIPNLLRSKMAANEASAVGSLRTYGTAMVTYTSSCPDRGYPSTLTILAEDGNDCDHMKLLPKQLGADLAMRSGYKFEYHPGTADEKGRITSFSVTADPMTAGTTGVRHFFTDESLRIRYDMSSPASVDSQPLQ